MIRFIAAIDSGRGMANEQGMPWDLPQEMAYFRQKTSGGTVLMGYGTYVGFPQPLSNRRNLVASRRDENLRNGFEKVADATSFLKATTDDVWVIGGARLFEETLDLAEELYLTRIRHDFECTKFFPEFEHKFILVESSEPQTEKEITYTFEIWRRK